MGRDHTIEASEAALTVLLDERGRHAERGLTILGATLDVVAGVAIVDVLEAPTELRRSVEDELAVAVQWRQHRPRVRIERTRWDRVERRDGRLVVHFSESPDVIPVRAVAATVPRGVAVMLETTVHPGAGWTRDMLDRHVVEVTLPVELGGGDPVDHRPAGGRGRWLVLRLPPGAERPDHRST